MRHTYLPDLVTDLIGHSSHSGIKLVEPWRGIADPASCAAMGCRLSTFVSATGLGGRRLPDWKAANWGVMA
ncbi:hypothetical protein [Polymorphospora rubra]|uniref:Uncharacterized protein n=1 Tax=Polymorphospora rubra TaxID=338584 RepID=A0A810MZY3_9ACTN|nr:hypothetical protein [Polymorphospora rubra]BCJ65113.1 hypothetical protein Prubr_21340 [Polymorphospora rubra]